MSMRRGLTIPDLANLLGKNVRWFYRNHKKLTDDHGFPPPVPGLGHVWDSAAINDWLDQQRQPALILRGPDPKIEINWDNELEARLQKAAAPERH